MNRFKKYVLGASALCMLATGLIASKAYAEYKPNRRDTTITREQVDELGYTGLLPQDSFRFTIYQRPNAPDYELTLKIFTPLPVSGCFKTLPYEATDEIKGQMLEVYMDFPVIMPDRDGNCDNVQNTLSTEVLLDKDELIDNDINKFLFRSKYGVITYDLYINEDMIELSSPNDVFQEGLEYWFLPSNAVVLSVPMAKDNLMNHKSMLQDLAIVAETNDLIPIEEKFPDYMPKEDFLNRFYFLDTDGDVREQLNNGSTSVTIGQIYRTEPFYGPNGKYDKKVPIDVVATMPDVYD